MVTGLTLYGYLDSGNSYKIRLLLAQLSRPYAWRELDIMQGESRTPELLRKNTNGRTVASRPDGATSSASRSTPAAKPMPGTSPPPSSRTSPS